MKNNDFIVFVPYGSRLGFHENSVAATLANIDYKFPQCVCYSNHSSIENNADDIYKRAMFCDLYHWTITGQTAATLTANTCASANHAGPSILIANYVTDEDVITE